MMNLKPLFERETEAEHLKTVKENIELVGGRLYGNKEQSIADKLELMEQAVKIQDEVQRQQFVSLIGKWHYVATARVEAYEALKCVKAQLVALEKKRDSSP